jgi:hypothetical protein
MKEIKNVTPEKPSQRAVVQSPFRPSSAVYHHFHELPMLRQTLPQLAKDTARKHASPLFHSQS